MKIFAEAAPFSETERALHARHAQGSSQVRNFLPTGALSFITSDPIHLSENTTDNLTMEIEGCYICRRARSKTDTANSHMMPNTQPAMQITERLPRWKPSQQLSTQQWPRSSAGIFPNSVRFDVDRVLRAQTPDTLENTLDRLLRASPTLSQRTPPVHRQTQSAYQHSRKDSRNLRAQPLSAQPSGLGKQSTLSAWNQNMRSVGGYAPWPLSQAVPLVREDGITGYSAATREAAKVETRAHTPISSRRQSALSPGASRPKTPETPKCTQQQPTSCIRPYSPPGSKLLTSPPVKSRYRPQKPGQTYRWPP